MEATALAFALASAVLAPAVLASTPGPAWAQQRPWVPLSPEGKPLPVAKRAKFSSMTIAILDTPELRLPVMVIVGDLPATTPLPAEVEVPFPSRYYIQWAGEILGGPVSQDLRTDPRTERRKGYDVAVFTLNKARTAGIELPVPGMVTTSRGRRTVEFTWTSASPLSQVTLSVQVAASAKVLKLLPGTTSQTGPNGLQYSKTFWAVKPGQRLTMQLTYKRQPSRKSGGAGQGTGTPQAPGTASDVSTPGYEPPTWLVVFGIAGAVAALFVLAVRRRPEAGPRTPAARRR